MACFGKVQLNMMISEAIISHKRRRKSENNNHTRMYFQDLYTKKFCIIIFIFPNIISSNFVFPNIIYLLRIILELNFDLQYFRFNNT